jgi:hypothetical protein
MPRASVFLPKGSIRIISQKIHRLVNRIKEKKRRLLNMATALKTTL